MVLWGRTLIAYHEGSDGAGSYQVNWIIDLDKKKATRIVCPYHGVETSSAEWLDLKKLNRDGFWTVKKNEKLSMTRGFTITATKLKKRDWESRALEINVQR